MPSDTSHAGLNGVSDESARISGVLGGMGIPVKGVEGGSCSSGVEALAVAIWFAYLNEAARMFEQGYATRDDIDASMRFGCGYPIGPLAQLDGIGLDKVVAVLDALHEVSGDPRHLASTALVDRVQVGNVGQLSGEGFYRYESPDSPTIHAEEQSQAASDSVVAREIGQVGVVGTGTMATGIIEVFAKAGYGVVYIARSAEKVAKVRAGLRASLERAVSKGKLSPEDRDAVMARVTGTTRHADLAAVDIVLEAIVEDLPTKLELFKTLDSVCKPGTILATTTSSLSIADLAEATSRPADVIGMHFFNPAPVMKLVEVVSTVETSHAVTQTVVELCQRTRKHPVSCGDRAGFIVNFLLFPYLNDAVRAFEAQLTTIEDFDPLMKAWQDLPLGPFALLDVVGTDVSLAIEEAIFAAFGEHCYRPASLLEKTVVNGKFGCKTGEGFLTH